MSRNMTPLQHGSWISITNVSGVQEPTVRFTASVSQLLSLGFRDILWCKTDIIRLCPPKSGFQDNGVNRWMDVRIVPKDSLLSTLTSMYALIMNAVDTSWSWRHCGGGEKQKQPNNHAHSFHSGSITSKILDFDHQYHPSLKAPPSLPFTVLFTTTLLTSNISWSVTRRLTLKLPSLFYRCYGSCNKNYKK